MALADFEPRRVTFWLLLATGLVAATATPQELRISEHIRLDLTLQLDWLDAQPDAPTVVVANRVFIDGERTISRVRLSFAESSIIGGTRFQLRVFAILSEPDAIPTSCTDTHWSTVSLLDAAESTITPEDRVAAGSVWIDVPEIAEFWKRVSIDPPLLITRPTHLLVGYELPLADVAAALIAPQTDFATRDSASFVSFDGGRNWECFSGSLAGAEPSCVYCGDAYVRVRVEVEEPEE